MSTLCPRHKTHRSGEAALFQLFGRVVPVTTFRLKAEQHLAILAYFCSRSLPISHTECLAHVQTSRQTMLSHRYCASRYAFVQLEMQSGGPVTARNLRHAHKSPKDPASSQHKKVICTSWMAVASSSNV
jgi:hypothetical protein